MPRSSISGYGTRVLDWEKTSVWAPIGTRIELAINKRHPHGSKCSTAELLSRQCGQKITHTIWRRLWKRKKNRWPMTEQKDQIGDNAPAGSGRPINLDIEGDDRNTETRDQSHGAKDAGQEGDAPKTTDRSGYYNENDLQVWKDRYLRRNEDPSRRDATTGGMSTPKEITFKYRRTQPE
ncbi:hypothetical protein ACSBR1_018604 [Camellia fascicularis]